MNKEAVYKVMWQTNTHATFAPFAADVIGQDEVMQKVTRILAVGDLMYLQVEWKSWEKKVVA